MKPFGIVLAALLLLQLVSGCVSPALSATRTEFLLDTFVTVTLYGSDDEALLDGAIELCASYDATLDRHNPDSELSRLNGAGEEGMAVSDSLYELLELALGYCARSGGHYDITVAPVMDLWDFHGDRPQPPTPEQVESALALVDWRRVELGADNRVVLHGGAQVDLGSIAKGYIADQMADYLREQKVPGAIVNLGGNVITVGTKPGGKDFEIGIQKPFEDREEIAGSLPVHDLSLVSSGIYERYFRHEDKLYHHIVDAATGWPVENGLLSVTIICPSSADADAMSTLCFLLGLEAGLALVEGTPDTEAVFLQQDGTTWLSSGLEDRYKPA